MGEGTLVAGEGVTDDGDALTAGEIVGGTREGTPAVGEDASLGECTSPR